MISVNGLSVEVKKNTQHYSILKDINLDLLEGSITILSGKTGIGKTVFAKTISGLLPNNFVIKKGTFSINGERLEYDEIKKMTGKGLFYSPQNSKAALNPVLKIKTQFKDIKPTNFDEIKKVMSDLRFDNPQRILNSYPFELSEGECQRIIFIMGIVLKPRLFILDEPTTSLDLESENIVLNRIIKLNVINSITFLIMTHDLDLLKKLQTKEEVKSKIYHHIFNFNNKS